MWPREPHLSHHLPCAMQEDSRHSLGANPQEVHSPTGGQQLVPVGCVSETRATSLWGSSIRGLDVSSCRIATSSPPRWSTGLERGSNLLVVVATSLDIAIERSVNRCSLMILDLGSNHPVDVAASRDTSFERSVNRCSPVSPSHRVNVTCLSSVSMSNLASVLVVASFPRSTKPPPAESGIFCTPTSCSARVVVLLICVNTLKP